MRPTFDERDAEILRTRVAAYSLRSGPRVGDFALMPDGEVRRFTHAWDDGLQTTYPKIDGGGSFYLGEGYMSYSGCLDSTVPFGRIVDTGENRQGRAWFFHHDHAQAHNGVDVDLECRVYRVLPEG